MVHEKEPSLYLVSPWYVMSVVIPMSILIFITSWMHFQVYVPADEIQSVQPLSGELLKTFTHLPTRIATGFVITRFLNFNIAANQFTVEGTIWFYYDPAHVAQSIIDGIAFENGTFVEKSEPYSEMIGSYRFVRYAVRLKFDTQLNYRAFPDDDHHISIVMTRKGIRLSDYIFQTSRSDFVIQDTLEYDGWSLFDHSAYAGYVTSRIRSSYGDFTMNEPAVLFGIDVRRISMREFITILFPMIIMLIMSMSAFSVSGPPERLSLTLSSIAGLVAFRFVMDSIAPKVPYFMLSDYLFLLFLAVSVFLFLVNIVSSRLAPRMIKAIILGTALFVSFSCTMLWVYF